ncbi:chalcone-flavanone isomerase-domain-containing protein [Dendryphion nanum]|uniref:Chalcone-flavanone isomerase-domain-containing protein n=1 Tax=Dendryphion nanum TaxID=256645 RepID=A0A9P9EGA6_9PLEO|nr:chalcone-flavanone isomerase-domain-containing protein [Dendryphion nanum]
MSTARLVTRRPLFRCLNAPIQQPRYTSKPFWGDVNYARHETRPPVHNVDQASIHRADVLRQAQLAKRRTRLILGAALSMLVPVLLIQFWEFPEEAVGADGKKNESTKDVLDLLKPRPTRTDSPRIATEQFQGKKVVVAAGDKIIAAPQDSEYPSPSDADTIELVETGTSYVPYFPRTITLPTATAGPEAVESDAEYTLLGLGIRRVSFLNIQVYVVGLYVRTSDMSTLQNHLINTVNPSASTLIAGEKQDLRDSLLDAEKSIQVWESILAKQGLGSVDMAFRVVPTRGTDFKHLQDGWMRGIASRTDEVRRKQAELLRQQATESKQISLPKPVDVNEFSDESFGLAMKQFKSIFQGRGKAPKGSVILMTRSKDGALNAMYQSIVKTNKGEKMGELTRLGKVEDKRVSRLVWLLYLGGQNVSSEEARRNIVDGCVHIVERPVGTVEGMVQ